MRPSYRVAHFTCPPDQCCRYALQLTLMRNVRQSILENRFEEFVLEFMSQQYPTGEYDQWVVDALASVNITLGNPQRVERQVTLN